MSLEPHVLRDPPEVQRRLLRSILREEREKAGLTQKEAASRVLWSLSKLIRIETGVVPVAPADVRLLLIEYDVSPERRDEVVELATQARRPDEWAEYRDILAPAAVTLFSNERAASVIQKFEPSLVPGLFQTEEYAKALLQALDYPSKDVERLWELRARRQEILRSPDRPDLNFIIGEASVSRSVGGTDVMRRQIDHLKELALNPDNSIILQLLPFEAGAYRGIGNAFTILQFRDAMLPDLLYLEDSDAESVYRDDQKLINRYKERFWRLWLTATRKAPEEQLATQFVADLDRIAAYHFPKN